ncbi:Imm21 family immunity protein [Micromonospora nigra]|uniref:Imm21 family immunity protein n=1 Tax=Micromonospora nigra TaxID=145857 RepID=UPI001FE22878|nr:Imm21 family immunity protein [Micromonospora nigra]
MSKTAGAVQRVSCGLAPRSALSLWTGVDSTDENWGDYGRACAIDGYVGVVAVGQRQALVLGDEPAATTYLSLERLFLRWAAADEEDDLVSAARRAVRVGVDWDPDEDVRWVVDGPVVMSIRRGPERSWSPTITS